MSRSQKSTKYSSTFLDANILLEIVLSRPKRNLVKRFLENSSNDLHISALTAHLVMHFGVEIVETSVLRKFLGDYDILSLDPRDIEWAFINSRNKDFEDALQLAGAIRNGCDRFVTFDKKLVSDYLELPSILVSLLDNPR